MRILFIAVLSLAFSAWSVANAAKESETADTARPASNGSVLEEDQLEFLHKLMKDTFTFIDYACDPESGLPQNTQDRGGFTNSTPIGLYIASLAVAAELGIIEEREAAEKFGKLLDTLEKIKYKHGFFPNFINLDTTPTWGEGVMIISDYNIYPAGLIVARQVWPQYADRIGAYLDSIQWERLYNQQTNQVVAGYDLATEKAAFSGLWLASDARCAVVMMIGSGAVPAKVWEGMILDSMETKTGRIYQPGFSFGVTYIAAITGLFMNERDTNGVGETVGNLGWYQYQFSRRRGFPLWGWSNCMLPEGGYTVGGYIPEWDVTPHALALLIDYYPRHVTAALMRMKELGGDVPPERNEGVQWGLRGCYDMRKDKWGDLYLQLEQGMMFLALANYLHDGIVRNIFESDPLIAKGLELSKPYIKHDPKWLKRWEERDAQPIIQTPLRMDAARENAREVVTSLDLAGLHTYQPGIVTLQHKDGVSSVAVKGGKAWKQLGLGLAVPSLDIARLDRLELAIEFLDCDVAEPGYVRLLLHDKFNQSRMVRLELKKDKKVYKIPARDIYGFFLDDDVFKYLAIHIDSAPAFSPWLNFKSKEFSLVIKSIKVVTKQ